MSALLRLRGHSALLPFYARSIISTKVISPVAVATPRVGVFVRERKITYDKEESYARIHPISFHAALVNEPLVSTDLSNINASRPPVRSDGFDISFALEHLSDNICIVNCLSCFECAIMIHRFYLYYSLFFYIKR